MAIKKSNAKARVKKKSNGKSKNAKAAIVAQEIKFTRLLANNSDKKVTDKALKSLRRWLVARAESKYEFTENNFKRIWKGLFYCMWMSDKHLVQEETAEVLSNLVHCFKTKETMLLYTKSALMSLSSQWFGIDKYRMDKFDMLIRRIIRQTFAVFKNNSWDLSYIEGFTKILEELIMSHNASLGMVLQIIEVYMEELAKVSGGNLPKSIVTELIRPFALYMVSKSDDREIKSVMKNIFRYLIFQSDVGMEYQEKFQAWKSAGFPCGSIKDVQKIELSDEEDDESDHLEESSSQNDSNQIMDPRAGRVDVELPQIPFDAKEIVALLTMYKFHKQSTTRGRKNLVKLVAEFDQLSKGEMPLGIKEVTVPAKRKSSAFSKRATTRLLEFESKLYSDTLEGESEELQSKKMKRQQEKKKRKIEEQNNVKKAAKKLKMNEKLSGPEASSSKKRRISFNKGNAFDVKDVQDSGAELIEDTSKIGTTNGWDVSDDKPTNNMKSMTPVVERLDISNTNFIQEILRKSEQAEKSYKSPTRSSKKLHQSASMFKTPTRSTGDSSTKVINPMAMKSKSCEAKKRVKIMLQRNTAQHTSEYLRQLKQSPAIPYDANRKPLMGVLKASPIPSPINPFYKRNSL